MKAHGGWGGGIPPCPLMLDENGCLFSCLGHFILGERAPDMDVLLGGPQNQCGCVRRGEK